MYIGGLSTLDGDHCVNHQTRSRGTCILRKSEGADSEVGSRVEVSQHSNDSVGMSHGGGQKKTNAHHKILELIWSTCGENRLRVLKRD